MEIKRFIYSTENSIFHIAKSDVENIVYVVIAYFCITSRTKFHSKNNFDFNYLNYESNERNSVVIF